MEYDKRHEELFLITPFGVVYYSSFWRGDHCFAAGVDLHADVSQAIAACNARECALERLALLLPC